MSEFLLHSAEQTDALGAALYRALDRRPGAVIFLEGPLGAGKTTLARGLLRASGVTGTIRSPTYTLMEPYAADGKTLLHVDLYRLQAPGEIPQLGLSDYPPEQCWWLVEWPERGFGELPAPDLRVALEHVPEGRRVRLSGPLATASLLSVLRSDFGSPCRSGASPRSRA